MNEWVTAIYRATSIFSATILGVLMGCAVAMCAFDAVIYLLFDEHVNEDDER